MLCLKDRPTCSQSQTTYWTWWPTSPWGFAVQSSKTSIPKPERSGRRGKLSSYRRSASSPDLTSSCAGSNGPLRRPSSSPSRGSPMSPARTHLQGTLDEIHNDFGPMETRQASSPSASPKISIPSPEAAISKLRRLRLTRGISFGDLQALVDGKSNGTLSKADIFRILLAVPRTNLDVGWFWGIEVERLHGRLP